MVATLIVSIVFFWFLGQRLVHAENLHMSYAGISAYNVPFWVTKRPACLPSQAALRASADQRGVDERTGSAGH